MELDDVFYIGRRPATLRMVLGLMEDADNSLETYHWATPALLHAIHTNDKLLSQYVEEVFQRKGLTPYVPKKKDDDISAEKTTEKIVMEKHVMWSKAKMAIEELMSLKDAKGEDLFCQKNHWWAVFRLFVDLQVCYIRENRYKGFIELIDSLGLEQINAPLDMATLSNITQDIFRFPFTKWELMIPKDASTRWLTAYTRMYEIADSLKRILITKGF
ncbi:MAG: hypothetical protein IJ907_03170 [Prevotella sp.]|jgi:hypothetical protein|nr:hypothetical protein [Prevotella sp.]